MAEMRRATVAAYQGRRSGVPMSNTARTAVVWEVLRAALGERAATSGRPALDVVDAGGGTGGFAVPLAELGHRVTVVDPSPDALAALERRAAESGVTVRGLQGDADDLLGLVGTDAADLVLCHSVLEYVDAPAATMASLAQTVRPGGAVSVLAAGRLAAVLHRALAGRFDDSRRLLAAADADIGAGTEAPSGDVRGGDVRGGDDGRAGRDGRAPVRRRFTRAGLSMLATGAGLRVAEMHGIRIFTDLVAGGAVDAEHDTAEALVALESAASTHPVLSDLGAQLHLLAERAR